MKRNLGNFTRGSQLIGHFSFMFAAGLKLPLIAGVILLAIVSYVQVRFSLTDHQFYLIGMDIYARFYGFIEFDPDKLIALKQADGSTLEMAISVLSDYPPVEQAVSALWKAIGLALVFTAIVFVPAFFLFYWILEYFGGSFKEKKFVRGASLVKLGLLKRKIWRNNFVKQHKELRPILGWFWWLAGAQKLIEAGYYIPAKIAGVSYPWRKEIEHTMLIGTTGTGKTVALLDLITQARAKGQRAVVFDLTGAFISRFYDPSRDMILNPMDARCPQWSIFDECSSISEFHAASEALIPSDGGGNDQFWVLGARSIFMESCMALVRAGTPTNAALAERLMTADLSEVHKLVEGTLAEPMTSPEAAKMAISIRAVLNANAHALMLLPTSGPRFSIRDWVRAKEDIKPGSILFISARYVDLGILSKLLTLWMNIGMHTLMSMTRTDDLRLWFIIDELGALHRLPALEQGLQTARNFAGAIVTGIHTYDKLKEVYGEDIANTLASLSRTKLVLACGDDVTAEWCSDAIGKQEVIEIDEGYSYGHDNARDAVTSNSKNTIRTLALADELTNLKSLTGYIKFPDGFPAAKIKLKFKTRPIVAEEFIPRSDNPGMDRALPKPKPGPKPSPKPGGSINDGDDPVSGDNGPRPASDGGAGIEPPGVQEQLAFDAERRGGSGAVSKTDDPKSDQEKDRLSAVFTARGQERGKQSLSDQKTAADKPSSSKKPSTRNRLSAKEADRFIGANGNAKREQKSRSASQAKSAEDNPDPTKEQREGAIGSRIIEDRDDMDIG